MLTFINTEIYKFNLCSLNQQHTVLGFSVFHPYIDMLEGVLVQISLDIKLKNKKVFHFDESFESSLKRNSLLIRKYLFILKMDKQLLHDTDNLQLQSHLMSPMFQYLQDS